MVKRISLVIGLVLSSALFAWLGTDYPLWSRLAVPGAAALAALLYWLHSKPVRVRIESIRAYPLATQSSALTIQQARVKFPNMQYDPDGSRRLRGLHIDDYKVAGQNRRRSIQNWQHVFRKDSGLFIPVDSVIEEPGSLPYDWQGVWDFKWARMNSPLQQFISDADSGALNGCLWGARLSWRPDLWVNYKLLDTNAGVTPTLDTNAQTVTWPGVLNAPGHLQLRSSRHRLDKVIQLNSQPAGWPRIAIRQAPGCTFQIVNESYIRFLDPDGAEYMKTYPAYGWWGDSDSNSENATQGRLRIVDDGTIVVGSHTLRVIRLVPLAADWSAAAFPIYLDPSLTISGSTDLEDNALLSGGNADKNYGAKVDIVFKNNGTQKGLCRVVSSALPAGTYNSVDINVYPPTGTVVTCTSHRILPANDWVEGASDGVIESGAACWNWVKYNTQAWAGSAGCSTSGTDYQSDNLATFGPYTGGVSATESCTAAGVANFEAWANGTYANEGFMMGAGGSSSTQLKIDSQEGGTPWTVDIDYTPAGSPGASALIPRRYG